MAEGGCHSQVTWRTIHAMESPRGAGRDNEYIKSKATPFNADHRPQGRIEMESLNYYLVDAMRNVNRDTILRDSSGVVYHIPHQPIRRRERRNGSKISNVFRLRSHQSYDLAA